MTPPSPRLVDTHAHLCDPCFDDDREAVLARARAAGVRTIVAVGEHLHDARKTLDLARTHPMIRAAAGLYPAILDMDQADSLEAFIRRHRTQLVAIGEVGLDYWVAQGEAQRALQRDIFARFIRLSRELALPLNVHSRSAGRHAVALLLDTGATRVQMHAFDGRAAAAMPAVEAGFFFSIPPSIVRSRQKQKLVRQLPLEALLLESDSPVLGPDPSARNEPANLSVAIRAIAQIKAVAPEAVAEAAAVNFRRLYGDIDRFPRPAEPTGKR